MNMPANPVPGEPPEVQTLRTLLANAQEALLVPHVDRAIVGRRVAALRYALRTYSAIQAHVEALRDAKRLADGGDRKTAAMALNGSNARLAALLRPAATEPTKEAQ